MESVTNSNAYFESLGLGVAPEAKKEVSKSDEFLTLMLAQIQNQDPMDPMDNGEFLTQLAQIESAGGIADLKKSFDATANILQSNQALQASSMVGRSVLVTSNVSSLRVGNLEGAVAVPEEADKVTVAIYSESGSLVKTIDLGSLPEGIANFSWDGRDEEGNSVPDGQYGMQSTALFGSGYTEALTTMASATVESVTIGGASQGIALNLDGLGSRYMTDVLQIQ